MLDFLFSNKPVICCRCGEKLSEGQHVFRADIEDDAVFCAGCSYTVENEFIMIDGEPRASTEFMYDNLFDDGYYEIRKIDGLFVIMRFRHPKKEPELFLEECAKESFMLMYTEGKAKILIAGNSVFAGEKERNEVKKWAGSTFGEWSYRVVPKYIINQTNRKRFFSQKDRIEFLEYCQERIIGQKEELRRAVYMVIEYAECVMAGDFSNIRSWFLTAPSGSGKTEFYRTVRDYFNMKKINIPVLIYDLSNITPAGYSGGNTNDIFFKIAEAGSDGRAIFFLDESDKKFIPDLCGGGTDFNAAAQANLLSIVEGIETVACKKKIDTSKTMFVFLGAYQNIRDDKVRNLKKSGAPRIGFGAEPDAADISQKSEDIFYENITVDDMIEYGLMEQLAGRISQVVNFHRIPLKDMKKLIRSKADELAGKQCCNIKISDKVIDDMIGIAYTPLGVRAIINKLNELISDAVSNAFFDGTFNERYDEIVIVSENKSRIIRNSVRLA